MNLKNKKKNWLDFLEFKVKPFAFIYFTFLFKLYHIYISPFKADLKTIMNYYILKRRIEPLLNISSLFRCLTIVPTNICNARCVFCAYRFLNHDKEMMTFDIFKKSIDDYKKLGGKNLMFSPTIGEVLIDKNFFEKIKYAKKEGFYVQVFTNGILLNKNEKYKKIIESGIDEITISTGDIIPKYEAEVLGISQELALQKINGLLNLLEYKVKVKSNIKITFGIRAKRPFKKIWNSMKNTNFKNFFDKKLFHIQFTFKYDDWSGNIKQIDLLGIMKLKKRPLLRKYPCSSLWEISILSNGDVRLCGCRVKETEHDALVIGNITKESLLEIINGEKGKRILSDWMKGIYTETCINCRRYGLPIFIN